MKLISAGIIGAVLFVQSNANAQCVTVESAPLDADCVVMPFGDQRGVWFRLDKADELRRARLEAVELRTLTEKLERLATLRGDQLELYRLASAERQLSLKSALDVNERLTAVARRAREERDAAVASADAWYRSPFLWFGAGAVAT